MNRELDAKNKWNNEGLDEKIKDEFEIIEDEFLEDYDVKDMEKEINSMKNHGFRWDKLIRLFIALRWVFNIVIIAFPWMLWSGALTITNIVLNAWINKWWAKGNIWLLSNTVFGII